LGLVYLAGAVIVHRDGMVTFLPRALQDLLLRTTPFDVLVDDTLAQNLARRWGRVLLLCAPRSEAEVQVILQGLDHQFLDGVFRQGMVQMLPKGLRSLLLPPDSAQLPLSPRTLQVTGRTAAQLPAGQQPPWWLGGVGSLLANCVPPPGMRSACEACSVDLTPAGIQRLLQQKEEEKRRLNKEPALSPVLGRLLPVGLRQAAHQSLQLAWLASAASSGAWITSALFFCTPRARSTLHTFAFAGHASSASRQRASRAAGFAVGLSLLGAGMSLAFSLSIKWRWLPKALERTLLCDLQAEQQLRPQLQPKPAQHVLNVSSQQDTFNMNGRDTCGSAQEFSC